MKKTVGDPLQQVEVDLEKEAIDALIPKLVVTGNPVIEESYINFVSDCTTLKSLLNM